MVHIAVLIREALKCLSRMQQLSLSGETSAVSIGEEMQQRALQSKSELSRQRPRSLSKESGRTFKGMALGADTLRAAI